MQAGFLLYHNSKAFEPAKHELSAEVMTWLSHYFTLHSDLQLWLGHPRHEVRFTLRSEWAANGAVRFW